MANDLTSEQSTAIALRDVSVALSAGAGCGKTSVLTLRFISHLGPSTDAVDLSQLLAITFTDRAAREMRDRIRREVCSRLERAAEAETQHWLRLLRRLHTARISTIHSFCTSLLRGYAAEAGLDPGFRVLDGVASANLLLAAVDDELRARLSAHDDSVLQLAADFGLARLRTMTMQLLRQRDSSSLSAWLDISAQQQVERWHKLHRDEVLPALIAEFQQADCVLQLRALLQDNIPGHRQMAQRRTQLLETFARLGNLDSLSTDLATLVENARVQHGGGEKAWDSAEVYEQVKSLCEKLRDTAKELIDTVEWNSTAALPAAEAGLTLLRLAEGVRDRYTARKRDQQALDFDDLLVTAKNFLCSPAQTELRQHLAKNTALVLVDEFQDTDQVQVELIQALCGGNVADGKLFFVGDLKQSIYRFRGADPQVFQQLRGEIPAAGQLPLTQNFRSQPALIDFTNALFVEELSQGHPYEPLRSHRPQVTPVPAVEFHWAPAEQTGETADQLRQREADRIGRRLRQLLDSGTPRVAVKAADGNTWTARPAAPGDIAILFRALSDVEYYEAALRRYDIPYYLVGGHAFYSQQEVFDLLNLLRAVVSPADEVSLAGVLRSPFFSLTDESLYWLAQQPGGFAEAFWAGRVPPQLEPAQRILLQQAQGTIFDLHERKDRLHVAPLIQQALARTGYDALLVGEFLGERKLANLHKLIEMARRFDRSGLFTLNDFISQLAEFVARQPDEALAATQAETVAAVRMMTIHQAKGLEFPIVVLPDLDRMNRSAGFESAVFDARLGPLVRIPPGVKGTDAVCGFDLYSRLEAFAQRDELARLLYVAVTRAADYLILSSGVKQIGAARSPWMQLLATRFDLATGALLAELPPGYRTPQVEVITEPTPVSETQETRRGSNLVDLAQEARAQSMDFARVAAMIGPVAVPNTTPRRYSFSRLTGALQATSDDGEAWECAGNDAIERIDPLKFGTLIHAVLADFATSLSEPNGFDHRDRIMHHAGIYFPELPEVVPRACQLVEPFLAGERARQIAAAKQIYTELEFLCAWPPGDPNAVDYLEGFIDCLHQDPTGDWHLVDYKTNRDSGRRIDQLVESYEPQMLVYGLAAEQILGAPPASLVLHFLDGAHEVRVELNAATRNRARAWVEAGIAAARSIASSAAPVTIGA